MRNKRCRHCDKHYPATHEFFSPRASAKDGLYSWCKACMREATKKWKATQPQTPSQTIEYRRANTLKRRTDPEKWAADKQRMREYYRELRTQILRVYSGKTLQCACCQQQGYEFLSLDHKQKGGNSHRETMHTGFEYLRWFVRNNYPSGFQVLCHNCNQGKRDQTECPHVKRHFHLTAANEKFREKVLNHYGKGAPACTCCGEAKTAFLALDHLNGGGNKHRNRVGRGTQYYRTLIKENFPPGYQVLCHNCNQAKGFYGQCPHERERGAPPIQDLPTP